MVILDTDHITLLERVDNPRRTKLLGKLEASGAATPVVTVVSYEEQVRGWLGYVAAARSMVEQVTGYKRLLQQLQNYCDWRVLAFDEAAAVELQALRKCKLRVGTMDLKIAAITLVHDATLLTGNTSDFQRVPGLKIEDWSR
jgi:tRNA(fMet)-specific endonuclease VapC